MKYYLVLFYKPTNKFTAVEITPQNHGYFLEMEGYGTLTSLPSVRYIAEKAFGEDFDESQLLAGARTAEEMKKGATLTQEWHKIP